MPQQRIREMIDAFYAVYNYYGYGLLESVYSGAFAVELRDRGFDVKREVWVDVYYKGRFIGKQRVDFLVDDCVIVEVKSTEKLPPSAQAQLKTYLGVTPYDTGLLFHFGPVPSYEKLLRTEKRDMRKDGTS